ncbi:DUF6884 domain-containing protein [Kitasatospora sp. NPDC001574]
MAAWDAVNDSFCDEDGHVVDTAGWETRVVERDLAAWGHFTDVLGHGGAFLFHMSRLLRARPADADLTHLHRELVAAFASAHETVEEMVGSARDLNRPTREELAAETWHEMVVWAEKAPAMVDAYRSAEAVTRSLHRPPTGERLPPTAHQAVLAATADPDHLLAADAHQRTLEYLLDHGFVRIRPPSNDHRFTHPRAFARDRGPAVHLTEDGRQYALHHGATAPRRRAVVVSCGSRKAPAPPGDGALPAGDLYTGSYHRALRRAAEALTGGWGTVYILSGQYGIVRTDQPLVPYDTAITDVEAVTGRQLLRDAEAFDLAHADVLFLGGAKYAEVLRPAVPHCVMPLAGTRGIGEQMGLLKAQYDPEAGPALRAAWWAQAEEQAERVRTAGPGQESRDRPQDAAVARTVAGPTPSPALAPPLPSIGATQYRVRRRF